MNTAHIEEQFIVTTFDENGAETTEFLDTHEYEIQEHEAKNNNNQMEINLNLSPVSYSNDDGDLFLNFKLYVGYENESNPYYELKNVSAYVTFEIPEANQIIQWTDFINFGYYVTGYKHISNLKINTIEELYKNSENRDGDSLQNALNNAVYPFIEFKLDGMTHGDILDNHIEININKDNPIIKQYGFNNMNIRFLDSGNVPNSAYVKMNNIKFIEKDNRLYYKKEIMELIDGGVKITQLDSEMEINRVITM